MRQRLFKAISCVALMISVFFSFTFVSLADEQESSYWSGSIYTFSQDLLMAEFAGANNLNGSTAYSAKYSGSTNVRLQLSDLEKGHSYTGMCWFQLEPQRRYADSTASFGRVNVFCTDVQAPDGITVSFATYLSDSPDSELWLRIFVYFDNYYHVAQESDLNISFVMNIEQSVTTTSGGSISSYYFIADPGWREVAGTVYQTQVQADPNISDVYYVGQEQMQQQQQIANQQSQQSEQQHNSLINGYDNAANDTMLADKNSVLKGFEQQQDQAMSDGQQYVADFSANYDTAPLQAMAPAFMMISTWFNDLWGGMGNFSTVLFVGLMLCVAGYILKLKH